MIKTKKFFLCFLFFFFSPIFLFSLFFWGDSLRNNKVLGESTSISPQASMLSYVQPAEEYKVFFPTINAEDSTLLIIEKYLSRYNSPLFPYADVIVEKSEIYNVNPKLIVAIAQQESNLGKNSPKNCFNAWGWGIHAKGTKCYNSWPEAIESIVVGIANNYCAKGYCEDPCVMMKKYTPNSNGSWCAGVNHFLDDMETGNF